MSNIRRVKIEDENGTLAGVTENNEVKVYTSDNSNMMNILKEIRDELNENNRLLKKILEHE